jgi:hypothetical protein
MTGTTRNYRIGLCHRALEDPATRSYTYHGSDPD